MISGTNGVTSGSVSTCGFQDAGLGATGSLLLLLNLLTKAKMKHKTTTFTQVKIGKEVKLAKAKPLMRSDLASEASKNLLEKIRLLSQSSSVNEFQVVMLIFCQRAQKPNIPKNQPLQWLPQVY